MEPLQLIETAPGNYSLLLSAGETSADETIEALGLLPNGYFWQGVANFLMREYDDLVDQIEMEPEPETFSAHSKDPGALERLGALMSTIANSAEAAEALIEDARTNGHTLED